MPDASNDCLSKGEGVSPRKGWRVQLGVVLIESRGIFLNKGCVDIDKNHVFVQKKNIKSD
jgi:hypothetical protein